MNAQTTKHLSVRLAWHDSGWNGCICRDPKANTYCVGQYSYQADQIVRDRSLDWEQPLAGQPCSTVDGTPPCIHSINAFGPDELEGYVPPPSWFGDGTQVKKWRLAPYTVSTWPYEEMYKDEVLNPNNRPKYDPVKRRQAANEFFGQISPDRSLIFYYANYSNPFSENDQYFYVVVGAGRVKKVGPELTWIGQSADKEKNYGPNAWVRDITSHYPDQGLRIPYHLYMDRPDVLERILFVPENSRQFKYATRHISDDGALGLVERLSEIAGILQEIGDTSENWQARQAWLASVMAELWQSRGLYPGLLCVLDYLKFSEAIPYTMKQSPIRCEREVKDALFAFLQGDVDAISGLALDEKRVKAVRKQWRYLEPAQQSLLRDILPRFDFQTDQIRRIVDKPESASIYASHAELVENPYILSEQYVGDGPDDQISFSQIDHGVFPSPDLGVEPELEPDDWQRLRALCVEQLQRASQHTFLPADQVLYGLNHRLSFLPEWKRAQFKLRHLEVEQDEMSGALTYRREGDHLYLYRKSIFEDERLIETTLRQLATRPDIQLRFPVTEGHWRTYLYDTTSPLAASHPGEYEKAIVQQIEVCQQIFRRPTSVLCGAAGTGKTTVVAAIIQAIEKAHGTGTSFQLLAPTGKAADRLRERTGKDAATLHSFLVRRGWLNDNFTFKRRGGQREEGITTYIIDESSMLDLPLLATFFRAVNWNSAQRLIFVGDPNQLPPIGTGKVFADLIDWLKEEMPEHIGELTTNMRQLRNRLTGGGTGILDLASLYIRRELAEEKSADLDAQEDEVLARVQEGGDVAGDLRVLYWQTTDDLEKLLVETIVRDMEQDTGREFEPERPYSLWHAAMTREDKTQNPEASQVLSPYRGDLFGIEHLNLVLQQHKNGWWVENKGTVGGVTVYDKVIQVINRPQSRPIKAWNTQARGNEWIQVFNGEIGMTKIHAFDSKKWKWPGFHLSQFQVVFSRKQQYWVEYASENAVTENLELAYAISVHKAQGSEFQRVYFILPKHKRGLLSRELFYTGMTRAQTHCTLLVQEDISPILSLRRIENSHIARINSSLFRFRPVPPQYQTMHEWYEEGKIHRTLTEQMVRSKSEVIIANMLFDRDIPFQYEVPLYAPDGTFYLPDFTINWQGEEWYWEHLGMLHDENYRNHWDTKQAWYRKHGFAAHLVTTSEVGGFDSRSVLQVLRERFGI
ncbi:MAG: AAA family ATPase [Anaerolineae bacterium]|nr:AAA family ATPase [Anaerolineae bacterium]